MFHLRVPLQKRRVAILYGQGQSPIWHQPPQPFDPPERMNPLEVDKNQWIQDPLSNHLVICQPTHQPLTSSRTWPSHWEFQRRKPVQTTHYCYYHSTTQLRPLKRWTREISSTRDTISRPSSPISGPLLKRKRATSTMSGTRVLPGVSQSELRRPTRMRETTNEETFALLESLSTRKSSKRRKWKTSTTEWLFGHELRRLRRGTRSLKQDEEKLWKGRAFVPTKAAHRSSNTSTDESRQCSSSLWQLGRSRWCT